MELQIRSVAKQSAVAGSLPNPPVLAEMIGTGPMRHGDVLLLHAVAFQITTAVRIEGALEDHVAFAEQSDVDRFGESLSSGLVEVYPLCRITRTGEKQMVVAAADRDQIELHRCRQCFSVVSYLSPA